jgi:nucleoside-diphosphate-sugar epimerase
LKVFITGGTGLVGSHAIIRLTAAGHTVDALVRSDEGATLVSSLGARPVKGNLDDPDLWDSIDHDTIVHAAAVLPRSATWDEFEAVNVHGTRMVANAAVRAGAHLIYISTVAVYGSAGFAGDGSVLITEDTPFEPLHEFDYYGRSKRAAEQALWEIVEQSDINAVALRPCLVYGERDRLFSPKLVEVMRSGYWPLAGRGDNNLTVVYAGNVADAIMSALKRPKVNGAFNITNDGTISQRRFFALIAESARRKVRFIPVPQTIILGAVGIVHGYKILTSLGRYGGFVGVAARWLHQDNPYSSEKAKKELNWTPSTTPEDAAKATGEWYSVD